MSRNSPEDQGAKVKPSGADEVRPSEGPEFPSSFRGWLALLLRPTAVSAIIGLFGTVALVIHETQVTKREALAQAQETQRSLRAENLRFYTGLITREEESKRELRVRMLEELLRSFAYSEDTQGSAAQIEQRLLSLELLSRNFADSLDIKPLFTTINKEISDIASRGDSQSILMRAAYESDLHRVARDVRESQLAKLGIGFDLEVPLFSIGETFHWPEDFVSDEARINNADEKWRERLSDLVSTFELEGVRRQLSLSFSWLDRERRSIQTHVVVREPGMESSRSAVVESTFRLDFFDFPMIQNIELSGDHRLAIVMNEFDDVRIHISVAYFPGVLLYSTSIRSLREHWDHTMGE